MAKGNNIEKEYADICKKNDWPAVFQRIKSESQEQSGSCLEAIRPENKNLNRYRDVSPYDHSRIILQKGTTNYINANLIKVEKANRQYILTQGPLVNTVSHFWLMVWEQNSKAVLMLNKLIEKKQEKCYQYWPAKIGSEHIMEMADVGLKLEYLEQQDHSYYLTRKLKLTDTANGDSREVLHFHYTTWPDFGVPCSPTAFLGFLRHVRESGALEANVGPSVVHCSAGIGRSGTLCLVDSCLVLIEKFGIDGVDVKEILLEMRKYRMGLIQTPDQLRFSYLAIIEGAKQLLNINNDSEPEQNNHVNNVDNNHSTASGDATSSEDDEPPPSPPPRFDSLHRPNGLDRPLPPIPKSESCDVICDETPLQNNHENEGSSEDELEEESEDEEHRSESPLSDKSDKSEKSNLLENSSSEAAELRHRKRVERKEHLQAQVRDMKRRQQVNEQWTQLKRSLYLPLVIGGTLLLGGGLIAYYYWKN